MWCLLRTPASLGSNVIVVQPMPSRKSRAGWLQIQKQLLTMSRPAVFRIARVASGDLCIALRSSCSGHRPISPLGSKQAGEIQPNLGLALPRRCGVDH